MYINTINNIILLKKLNILVNSITLDSYLLLLFFLIWSYCNIRIKKLRQEIRFDRIR